MTQPACVALSGNIKVARLQRREAVEEGQERLVRVLPARRNRPRRAIRMAAYHRWTRPQRNMGLRGRPHAARYARACAVLSSVLIHGSTDVQYEKPTPFGCSMVNTDAAFVQPYLLWYSRGTPPTSLRFTGSGPGEGIVRS
eukprot:4536953-Pleurochrysis_carterae.AAC.3